MTRKDHILSLIKQSVQQTAPGATLILYGSYARGDYHEESDIDLLILLDMEKVTRDEKIKITYPLYDIGFDSGVIISPIVYSRDFWNNKHMVTPFYKNVNKEGIAL